MAIKERDTVIRVKDENGQEYIEYPATRLKNVIGLPDALDEMNSRIDELGVVEYGMRWVHGSKTGAERCIRRNGTLIVGEDTGLQFSVNDDGSFNSSFLKIYPWSAITRMNVSSQIMSRIPKYYIIEEFNVDGYDYKFVCRTMAREGYRCPAIFLDADGNEKDYYYLGSYESTSGSLGRSVSGATYNNTNESNEYMGYTITQYRTAAQALGSGWGITPVAEIGDMWQMLLVIEFGTRDVQDVAAGVVSIVDPPIDDNFDNPPYRTGMCDNVPNLHGIYIAYPGDNPAGKSYNYKKQTGMNNGANPFVWHGIENPYGMIEKWIDGLTFKDGVCYACNDRTKFATDNISNYTKVNYTVPSDCNYIKELGYDPNVPYCRMPTEVTETSDEYYCDWWEPCYSSGFSCASFGGGYNDGSDYAGAWCVFAGYGSSYSYIYVGSRLSYSPV